MTIKYTNSELQLSGVVTNAEFYAATSTAGLSLDSNRQIYVLEANLRFLSGVDTSNLNDIIIETNDRQFYFDSGVIDTTLEGITFISSTGRSVSERNWANDNGGGFLSLKRCRYIHNVRGNPGGSDARYLDGVMVSSLENSTIGSSEFTEQEVDVRFQTSGRVKGFSAKRLGRIVVEGTSLKVFLDNPKHFSRGSNGGYVALFGGASAMLLNYVPDKTFNQDLDNWNGQVADHWCYWLGSSVENFSKGPNIYNLVIKNRKNTLHNVAGGARYYKFIGGYGAKVEYHESGTAKPFLVDFGRADMLNTNTSHILDSTEEVEIITQQFTYDAAGGWTRQDKAGQKIIIRKLGKVFVDIDCSGDKAIQVIGSEETYTPYLLLDDKYYNNTLSRTREINTITELYDLIHQALADDLSLPSDLFVADGKTRTIKSGYSLVRDQFLTGSPVQISGTQIKVLTGGNGLQKDETADTLVGTVDSGFDGNTDMLYVKANGKVDCSLSLILESGISSSVWGVWLKSQGTLNRVGITTNTGDNPIELTAGDEMCCVADAVSAYRGDVITFTVGPYGNTLTQKLSKIKRADGSDIVPDSLNTAQQRIADMMNYNKAAARVDITLPADYLTDERWDAITDVWTFKPEDFLPLAFKAEQIQSSQGALLDPSTVRIEDYAFVLNANSTLTFRQDAANVNCVINMNRFTIRREGDNEQINTFLDHHNGALLANSGNPIIAAVDGGFTDDDRTNLESIPKTQSFIKIGE